jgi:L-seryl-tRNA(Ser) seleniumtransferase
MNREAKVKPDPRRALPAVDRLVAEITQLAPKLPGWAALAGSREVLERARAQFAAAGSDPLKVAPLAELAAHALEIGRTLSGGHPRRVVNATGIPLHTNLGRAPLAPGAAAAVAAAAQAYSNLELDLSTGKRGNRLAPVCAKLELLTDAEASLVVNNNASALLLALDTLARGKQVVVSRGELVEIGGSFRVPDIMERAGVELVEAGTTNRTHPADYANAIGPDTALLLKVHRSNFELSGFVAEASLGQLAEIGAAHGVPVVEDLGSGTLIDLSDRGFPAEIYAPARLGLGADVVCFSGDKLLGGPQAGLLLGSRREIDAMRKNPLARALRIDKLSLAALDWTLEAYLDGRAEREIPVLRQLLTPLDELEERARALADRLAKQPDVTDRTVTTTRDRSFVGGGSLPGFELDSWVVTVRSSKHADRVAEALREGPRPVLARVRDGAVVLDVRTLLEGDEDIVEAAFAGV